MHICVYVYSMKRLRLQSYTNVTCNIHQKNQLKLSSLSKGEFTSIQIYAKTGWYVVIRLLTSLVCIDCCSCYLFSYSIGHLMLIRLLSSLVYIDCYLCYLFNYGIGLLMHRTNLQHNNPFTSQCVQLKIPTSVVFVFGCLMKHQAIMFYTGSYPGGSFQTIQTQQRQPISITNICLSCYWCLNEEAVSHCGLFIIQTKVIHIHRFLLSQGDSVH